MRDRDDPGLRRGVLLTLFRYEMKMLLRDRRTILVAVVVPLLLLPIGILVLRQVERSETRRLEEAVYRYAVTGDRSDWARGLVEAALARQAEADTGEAGGPVLFEEAAGEASDSVLEAGDVHVMVEGLSVEAYRAILEEDTAWWGAGEEPDSTELEERRERLASSVPVLRLRYRGQSDFSRNAESRLRRALADLRSQRRDSVFRARGFPVDPGAVADVETIDAASAGRRGGGLSRAFLPLLLMLMVTGGSIAAADAISGEKERGTLETLLTTAARRSEIVSAKQLGIIVVGLAVAVVVLLDLLVLVVLGLIELPREFALSLSVLDLGLLLLLLVPLAVLVSSALLLLSGYARSYREYQIYFFPLLLVIVLPSAVAFLPGIDLRSAVALVPIAGISVGAGEILLGEYDVLALMLAFVSTSLAAIWVSRLTEKTLSTERLISQSDLEEADLIGGPALFPRHVLAWFLGLWVIFFVVSLWFGESLGVRGQVLVNLVGIFLGGSAVMIRRYRLPMREALALRPVHPAVWAAVLVGVPSAYLTGIGIAEAVNAWVFPVPREVLEAFGEMLTGPQIPLWQLLLLLAVLPGVAEEVAFRGVLLYGLRQRFRPWVLCLVVGAVFGFFHVSLFRIVPTAYLGAVLAAVVLLTGSILPAMVWHAANNALALVPAHMGWIEPDASVPLSWYPWAVVGLGVAFALLWRVRRPYPGLRRTRPRTSRSDEGGSRGPEEEGDRGSAGGGDRVPGKGGG